MNGSTQMYSPSAYLNSNKSNSEVSPRSNTNRSKNDLTPKKSKQNLVLSTSFVSSRRIENGSPSPTSPLQTRRTFNNVTKMLLNIKGETNRLQHELADTRKKKDEIEKVRDTTGTNIYSGTYSTEHLQKHSMRIRTNTQIRELDKTIKKLEKEIQDLNIQYERTRKMALLEKGLSSYDSISIDSSDNLTSSNLTESEMTDHNEGPENNSNNANNISKPIETSSETSSVVTVSTVDRTNMLTPVNDTMESATWKISEYMQSLREANLSSEFVLTQANKIVSILREHPELRQDLLLKSFFPTIQSLLLKDDMIISSAVYRMCRYLIDGEQFVQTLIKLRIDSFLIMSLAKENNRDMEREQAIKLLRTFADYKTGITNGLVQAVISCIERGDDSLRNINLETLLEFCFTHPEIVNECRGMRVLEDLLKDYSSFALASLILDTILTLMGAHSTRKHFLDDFNISVLVTVFSDSNSKSSINIEKLQNSSVLISRALKNDNGLLLFSMDNFKPIKELIAFLQIPLCAQYLVDIFLDVLQIHYKAHKGTPKTIPTTKSNPSQFLLESSTYNQHLALIITILDNCKFHEHLSSLIENSKNKNLKEKVVIKTRYLLAEFLNMRNNLIRDNRHSSVESTSKDQSITFEEIFEFYTVTQEITRNRNTLGISGIDYGKNMRLYSKTIKESTLLDDVDDLRFRKMVYDSKVLQTKDFTSWNWNIIQELLEGPLMNKKQLEELVKSTKFIRRLLIFYRPLRLRFSNVNQGARLSQKYVQVGCAFFKMLTTNPEGMKILTDDTKIIPQLASLLFKAIEENSQGNIFNETSLRTKMIIGYFKFIGVLTQSDNGISILIRWNFFTVIYKMFQFDSRIGLKFLMFTLPELDLSHSSHCRNILGRALVVSNESIRMRATTHLGVKLKELITSKIRRDSSADANDSLQGYMMELLTRQLYDLSPNVVAIADQALYEYVMEGERSREFYISFRTILNQMVFISSPILFELLTRPYGFQLLNEINFVEQQRISWMDKKNKEYVHTVEEFLKKNIYTRKPDTPVVDSRVNRLPLHFYESLSKTEDGITLLGQSGDLVKFMNTIKRYVKEFLENEDADVILELKSALWCCGFIGSTEMGIGLLDNYSLVSDILNISYGASVTSVRFTAFYVLGLISSTQEGCEILDEVGWNCTINVQSIPMGITLPDRLDKFLSFNEKKWLIQKEYKDEMIAFNMVSGELPDNITPIEFNLDHLLSAKNIIENPSELKEKEKTTTTIETIIQQPHAVSTDEVSFTRRERASTLSSVVTTEVDSSILDKVLEAVSQLGNHILSSVAIKNITDLNSRYGSSLFENEIMFFKVMDMLNKYRFKPQVRKFLCELFINVRSLENVIRHDRKIACKNAGTIVANGI